METKIELVEAFNQRFQLTEAEDERLDRFIEDGVLAKDVFAILQHVQEIRTRAQVLQKYHPRGGLHILEDLGEKLELCFQGLCRWTLAQCEEYNLDLDQLHLRGVSVELFALAFVTLGPREGYLTHCAQELVGYRRVAIVGSYLDSLTVGGDTSGTARPIEANAHKPVRYVADVMAWTQQALASEREFAVSLFPERDELLHTHLDRTFDAMVRPLSKTLAEVLAKTELSFMEAFHIHNLMLFYAHILHQHLSSECGLVQALLGIARDALQVFLSLAKVEGRILLDRVPIPGEDLALPEDTAHVLGQIEEFLAAYESSAAQRAAFQPLEVEGALVQDLIGVFLDPLYESLAQGCQLTHLDPTDSAIYRINVLVALRALVTPFGFASNTLVRPSYTLFI